VPTQAKSMRPHLKNKAKKLEAWLKLVECEDLVQSLVLTHTHTMGVQYDSSPFSSKRLIRDKKLLSYHFVGKTRLGRYGL
jgi:hypothetical protein